LSTAIQLKLQKSYEEATKNIREKVFHLFWRATSLILFNDDRELLYAGVLLIVKSLSLHHK
jgi:hypothetical protein